MEKSRNIAIRQNDSVYLNQVQTFWKAVPDFLISGKNYFDAQSKIFYGASGKFAFVIDRNGMWQLPYDFIFLVYFPHMYLLNLHFDLSRHKKVLHVVGQFFQNQSVNLSYVLQYGFPNNQRWIDISQ